MESIIGKILCDRYRIIQEIFPETSTSSLAKEPQLFRYSEDFPLRNEELRIAAPNDLVKIYLAEDRLQNPRFQCVIKRLQPQYDHEILGDRSWQQVYQTFITQAKIWQNISQHPQLPDLLAFFECDREFYLVEEQVIGKSLEQQLQDAPISESEAVIWVQEVVNILDFIHQSGVAHCGIQPSSLIEQQNGKKFLSNFGLIENCLLLDDQAFKSASNPDLFPLESLEKPDFNTDIYALGKTIIYALTGNFAKSIEGKSVDITKPQKPEDVEKMSTADISYEFANVLNKMVSQDSEKRYRNVSEIFADINFSSNVITLPPLSFDGLSSLPTFARARTVRTKKANFNWLLAGSSKFKSIGKIIWFLLALPFFIASIIIFIGINKNSYNKFASYANNEYQFTIKYPQNWSQRQLDDPITGEVVVFASPLETDKDLFVEKLYITVEHLSSESTSLEQYTKTVFQRINQAKDSETEVYEDYITTIDNFPAHKVVYSRQEGGLQLKQMETFMIKDNQVYIAIYTAQEDKFAKFYGNIEKMIDSWEIQ